MALAFVALAFVALTFVALTFAAPAFVGSLWFFAPQNRHYASPGHCSRRPGTVVRL